MIWSAVLSVAALLGFAASSFAQSPSLARQIADGQPWSMTTAEGRNGRLTLRPDGTGQMRADPMMLEATWREMPASGFCFKPSIAPERCVTLRRNGAIVIGMRDCKEEFRLTR
jgi:hypothetical protein